MDERAKWVQDFEKSCHKDDTPFGKPPRPTRSTWKFYTGKLAKIVESGPSTFEDGGFIKDAEK